MSDFHTRLGLACPEMLLLWLPKDYLDLRACASELDGDLGSKEKRVYRVELLDATQRRGPKANWVQLTLRTEGGHEFQASTFGFARSWLIHPKPAWVYVEARLGEFREKRTLEDLTLINACPSASIMPVYKGRQGKAAASTVAEKIAEQFDLLAPLASRLICAQMGASDSEVARQIGFRSTQDWLTAVHRPTDLKQAAAAQAAAEKLAVLCATVGARQMRQRPLVARAALKIDDQAVLKFIDNFGAPPTGDQRDAITNVAQQMRSAVPMRAVLSADVGCGKSLVFLIPLLAAARNGALCGILVPRDLLVDKTVADAKLLNPHANVIAVRPGAKLAKPSGGTIYVGTTALLGALPKAGITLNALVVDEQHTFSVAQREALLSPHTHYLEVSATPLPRSMAVLAAGGLDVIELNERPFVRTVKSQIVMPSEARRLFEHLHRVIDSGSQAAVIYPRIDAASDDETRNSLAAMSAEWEKRFPGLVAVLSGRDTADERQASMTSIKTGAAKLIVSTTVIELGVTLPDLRTLVVVDAARLGTMQLHQLRGRVARLGGTGRFFMFSRDGFAGETLERLQTLCRIDNGFALAEAELDRKGAGDLTGEMESQSGLTRSVFPTIRITPQLVRKFADVARV